MLVLSEKEASGNTFTMINLDDTDIWYCKSHITCNLYNEIMILHKHLPFVLSETPVVYIRNIYSIAIHINFLPRLLFDIVYCDLNLRR